MFLKHDDVLFKNGAGGNQIEAHHHTNKAQPENTTGSVLDQLHCKFCRCARWSQNPKYVIFKCKEIIIRTACPYSEGEGDRRDG